MFPRIFRCMFFCLATVGMAACAADGSGTFGSTYSDTSDLTPAERRLREDNKVFNETILGGAATGAATGAIFGALAGLATGDLDNVWKGAAVGAAAGGVLGGLDGWRVAVKQEANRKQVREIDIATDKVLAENQQIQSSIDNMDAVIADTRGSLQSARAAHRANQGSLEEVRRQERRAEKNLELMGDLIENQEDRLEEQQEISDSLRNDGYQTAQIDADIQRTKQQLEQKKRERDILVQELEQDTV